MNRGKDVLISQQHSSYSPKKSFPSWSKNRDYEVRSWPKIREKKYFL